MIITYFLVQFRMPIVSALFIPFVELFFELNCLPNTAVGIDTHGGSSRSHRTVYHGVLILTLTQQFVMRLNLLLLYYAIMKPWETSMLDNEFDFVHCLELKKYYMTTVYNKNSPLQPLTGRGMLFSTFNTFTSDVKWAQKIPED